MLKQRAVIKTVAGATAMTVVICLLGFGLDDGGINPHVSEQVQDLTMISGMPITTIAIGIGVWDSFQRREDALKQERLSSEQIRQSRQRLVAADDDERSRIERDLHDGAQQHLVVVSMQLRLLRSTHDMADEIDPLVEVAALSASGKAARSESTFEPATKSSGGRPNHRNRKSAY